MHDPISRGRSFLGRMQRSLSTQLLMFTIACVFVAELFVLVPSVAEQRLRWLNERIEAAYLVGLALEAPADEWIEPTIAGQLFATANIVGVTVMHDGARVPIYAPDLGADAPPPKHYIDLRDENAAALAQEAWATMFSKGDDIIRVIGEPKFGGGEEVDILISEGALRRDLWVIARDIFIVSIVISTLSAGLIFAILHWMIVLPVRRLTSNMAAFNADPEDAEKFIPRSRRIDEIGEAEGALRALEERVHGLLTQRRRLAALGAGVSKISHDLRNILASAQLMSDRLAKSDDPRVRKLSPRLIQALDRAIALSRDTLNFARMEPASLSKSRFPLRPLVEEALADNAVMHADLVNSAPEDLTVEADRVQLYRALSNIIRNAVEATAPEEESAPPSGPLPRVAVEARTETGSVAIDIVDQGPGIGEKARALLFEPFQGSSKPGGSGLGVAIAREIMRAHGGALELVDTGASGTRFRMTLPDRG